MLAAALYPLFSLGAAVTLLSGDGVREVALRDTVSMYDLNDASDEEIKVKVFGHHRQSDGEKMRDVGGQPDAATAATGTSATATAGTTTASATSATSQLFSASTVASQTPDLFVATNPTVAMPNTTGFTPNTPPPVVAANILNFSANSTPMGLFLLNSSPNETVAAAVQNFTSNFSVGGALLDPCVGRCGSTAMASSNFSYAYDASDLVTATNVGASLTDHQCCPGFDLICESVDASGAPDGAARCDATATKYCTLPEDAALRQSGQNCYQIPDPNSHTITELAANVGCGEDSSGGSDCGGGGADIAAFTLESENPLNASNDTMNLTWVAPNCSRVDLSGCGPPRTVGWLCIDSNSTNGTVAMGGSPPGNIADECGGTGDDCDSSGGGGGVGGTGSLGPFCLDDPPGNETITCYHEDRPPLALANGECIPPTPIPTPSPTPYPTTPGPTPVPTAPLPTPVPTPVNVSTYDYCKNETDLHAIEIASGVSSDAERNFCRHLTSYVNPDADTGFGFARTQIADNGTCVGQDIDTCDTLYYAGSGGSFTFCQATNVQYVASQRTGDCIDAETHHCPWTFFMEDMIRQQQDGELSCHGAELEAKRSLDGLLHAVEDIYARIQTEETIIAFYNDTIRQQLVRQQGYWSEYLTEQETCNASRTEAINEMSDLRDDIDTLEEIANPSIRSAIDFDEAGGSHYGWQDPTGLDNIETSLLEQPSVQPCKVFSSLIERAQRNGIQLGQPRDCDEARSNLTELFQQTYADLMELYNLTMASKEDVYASCLTNSTYKYRVRVEGPLGIDEAIQKAAARIHEAQTRITQLEPMLHDVEHATVRVRHYLQQLRVTCAIDTNATRQLQNVMCLIRQLEECPGRNDFNLTIPDVAIPSPATPSPTPWAARPNALTGEETLTPFVA